MTTSLCPPVPTSQSPTHALVTSATTPLRELLDQWNLDGFPHRFVQNDDGLVDGIVDLRYIQQLLAAVNSVERIRWEDVTVGTLVEKVFTVPQDSPGDTELESPAGRLGRFRPVRW